ncbi:MAG TPA: MBL fold metallo-hydrolase [Spirochaetota bacterium]|nr:MBL fold metallo-hydrolase [Spirochaetota bacterium]HOH36952.1 MBL fold metallo-hydrolase [Spirochaetota bacterium]HPM33673.1 MBL fold metallo-hydrolase [Spirochaetota bacterium]
MRKMNLAKVLFSLLLISQLLFSADAGKVAGLIKWYGQAAVSMTLEGKKIVIDPLHISKIEYADIVMITHSHDDHLSPADMKKVVGPDTIIVTAKEAEATIKKHFSNKIISLLPGQKINIGKIEIKAVSAYNIRKVKFHPIEKKWLGFVITADGIKIYHTGDTEFIPEMKEIDADIIILPLGQTYTFDSVDEAVKTAIETKSEIAIPVHYGEYEGTVSDARQFAEKLRGKINVILKDKENER